MLKSRTSKFLALFTGLFLAFSMVSVDHADARRGGSFGSRGSRTFQAPAATRTAPQPTAPVQRTMTPNQPNAANPGNAARQNGAAQQRTGGLFGGLGRGLLGGVLLGGLLGMLMGQGFGGMAGMFGMLLQILVIGGVIMFAMRYFRSRNGTAAAGNAGAPRNVAGGFGPFGGADNGANNAQRDDQSAPSGNPGFRIPSIGGGAGTSSNGFSGRPNPANEEIVAPAPVQTVDINPEKEDLDLFETMLEQVQAAFSREDHGALRRLITPEMVSFMSEELAENAQNGLRNDVTDVKLLQADISEAWNENGQDYVTAAFRYESKDVMRERATGKVVSGDPDHATETVELWTFTRPQGGDWKLSAIQEG